MDEIETKTVTVEDIIAAAERNGYTQSTNGWFRHSSPFGASNIYGTKENPIVEACFMGQIALNLGVEFHEISDWFMLIPTAEGDLYSNIVNWNDGRKESYSRILGKVKTRLQRVSREPRNMRKITYHAVRKDGSTE